MVCNCVIFVVIVFGFFGGFFYLIVGGFNQFCFCVCYDVVVINFNVFEFFEFIVGMGGKYICKQFDIFFEIDFKNICIVSYNLIVYVKWLFFKMFDFGDGSEFSQLFKNVGFYWDF